VISAASIVISYTGRASLARLVGCTTVEPPFVDDVFALLPVAIDVTIVASTLVWLGQGAPRETMSDARGLGRV
jgi:hypothetical protein